MLDVELVNTPDKRDAYKSDGQLTWFYEDLLKVFKWGTDSHAIKKIKQCLSTKLTSAYQSGQMETRGKLNVTIEKQRQRIKELEERYEPKQKDQDRGYGAGKYSAD